MRVSVAARRLFLYQELCRLSTSVGAFETFKPFSTLHTTIQRRLRRVEAVERTKDRQMIDLWIVARTLTDRESSPRLGSDRPASSAHADVGERSERSSLPEACRQSAMVGVQIYMRVLCIVARRYQVTAKRMPSRTSAMPMRLSGCVVHTVGTTRCGRCPHCTRLVRAAQRHIPFMQNTPRVSIKSKCVSSRRKVGVV